MKLALALISASVALSGLSRIHTSDSSLLQLQPSAVGSLDVGLVGQFLQIFHQATIKHDPLHQHAIALPRPIRRLLSSKNIPFHLGTPFPFALVLCVSLSSLELFEYAQA
jgi:hypothetical protein